MIDLQTFLLLVLVISVFTSLTTEAVKKLLVDQNINYPANTLTGIIAVIMALAIGIGYMIMVGLAITVQTVVCLIALIFLGWLCAMVGYDKVAQTIAQLKTKKED